MRCAGRIGVLRWTVALCLALCLAVPAAGLRTAGSAGPAGSSQDRTLALIDSLFAAAARDSSQSVIEAHLPLARAERDSSFLVDLLIRQGGQWASFGRGPEAEPVLQEALAVAEARRDSVKMCQALRWLGVSVDNQGRSEEALSMYRRQLACARAIGHEHYEAWALVGTAFHADRAGRFQQAVSDYRRAVDLFRKLQDRESEIWAVNGLGVALHNSEDYDAALACYYRSAELAREIGYVMGEAMAENNIGTLEFSLGDPGVARQHFQRAYELQQQLGHERASVIPLNNIAYCQLSLGHFEPAAATLQETLAYTERRGYPDLHAQTLLQLCELRAKQQRPHETAALYRRALTLVGDMDFKSRVECCVGFAEVLAEQDSLETALSVLQHGEALLQDQKLGEVRLRLESSLGEIYLRMNQSRAALHHLMEVDRQARQSGLAGLRVRALALAARAYRGLDLPDSSLVLLTRAAEAWEAERSLPLDPEWREQRGATGRMIYTDLGAHLLEYPSRRPEPERIRDAFDRLQVFKARTLIERMLGPSRALTEAAGRRTDTIGLADFQQEVLQAGEIFLDFYLGPELSLLFAIAPDTCLAIRLPASDKLGKRLQFYHELISSPPQQGAGAADTAALSEVSRGLHRLLFAHLSDRLAESRRVIVAADGPSCLLSLADLPVAAGPGQVGQSLIASREWSQVPSATILARLRQENLSPRPGFDLKVLALAAAEADSGRSLPGAVREVRRLARRYRGVNAVIMTADRPEKAAPSLAGYDLLHLASHVRTDDRSPWQSEIRLQVAGEQPGLRAADISRLELSARLAVLASCESAGGRIVSGEGVTGLTTAFLSAGVPAVVATLWPVEDASTARLMEVFYRGLAAGETAAAALRRSQLALRADPQTSHPFFWAGFVLVGDGDLQVPLQERRQAWWLLPAVALILLGVMVVLAVRRRRVAGAGTRD